jgi:hypothetical protein
MEQKLKEIFDLDRIREFAETHIDQMEWIEEEWGEKRRILVIDTLVSGGHGVYIPGMVLELFGRVDRYDMVDPFDPEKTKALYDALACLEYEIEDCLNRLIPSKGWYHVGYHEHGSYCLFYEERDWGERRINVVVIEAGSDYVEQVDSWEMELPEDEDQAVAEAIEAVEAQGYTVLPNEQGGCNEFCSPYGDQDYIAVTVVPSRKGLSE